MANILKKYMQTDAGSPGTGLPSSGRTGVAKWLEDLNKAQYQQTYKQPTPVQPTIKSTTPTGYDPRGGKGIVTPAPTPNLGYDPRGGKGTTTPTVPTAPAPPAPQGFSGNTLYRGVKGTEVSYLQQLLGIPADGSFGGQTDAAVRAFQQAHGLTPDGRVGAQTRAALLGQKAPAPQQQAPRPSSGSSGGYSAPQVSAPAPQSPPANVAPAPAPAPQAPAQEIPQAPAPQAPMQADPYSDNVAQLRDESMAAQQARAAAMAQLEQEISRIMSPEYFQQLLQESLSGYDPLMQSNTDRIRSQFDEARKMADVDAARRGIFSSGAAQENQRQLSETEAQSVQGMVAELQALLTDQTRQGIDTRLNSAMQQADLARQYDSMSQQDRQYVGQLEQGYNQMGQQDRQFAQQLEQEYANMSQQDRQFAEQLGFQKTQLEQQEAQFRAELSQKNQQFNASQSAANAARKANDDLAWARLNLEKDMYSDQQTRQKSEQEYIKAEAANQAYSMLNSDLEAVKNGASWNSLAPKYNAFKNEAAYGNLYDDLMKTVRSEEASWKKQQSASASSSSNKGVMRNMLSPNNPVDSYINSGGLTKKTPVGNFLLDGLKNLIK